MVGTPEKPDISLVIACYNEMPHLPESVQEIEDVLSQTTYSYELIFIDDCSKDATRAEIEHLCAERKNARYVFHEKNVGRGGTVREGLSMARGNYAGFLDIDLEVHAWYIPVLIGCLRKGSDMACVERIEEWLWSPYNVLRVFFSFGYRIVSKAILPLRTPDTESGFKFFTMSTMADLIHATTNDGWFWDTEIVAAAEASNKKVQSVRAVFTRRPEKKSTVRLLPDTLAYLRALLQYRRKHGAKKYPAKHRL